MEPARILIIDDDSHFCAVLAAAFERRGYRTTSCHEGASALAACAETSFDMAVLDLKLEQESGLHLIAPLKARQPDLRIVVLTGYSSIATAVEAVKLGAENYLCKPASVGDILGAFTPGNPDPNTDIPIVPPSVERLEWEHIQRELARNDGNISATARSLGMHRRTLQRKLQKRPVRS